MPSRRLLAAYALARQRSRVAQCARASRGFFSNGDTLEPNDFPENIRAAVPGARRRHRRTFVRWKRSRREAIAATLEATHYKIGRASEILGISRKTLLEKRKKYELK